MVKVREDLTGKKFNRLTIICQAEDYISKSGRHYARWLCQCSCGSNPIVVLQSHLKGNKVQSCGCLQKERAIEANKKYNIYDLSGNFGIGWTNNTNKEFYFDLDKYNDIKDICWCEALRRGMHCLLGYDSSVGRVVPMHIYLGYKNYDHINRNELDNRSCNLRQCTQQENTRNQSVSSRNSSGVIGVVWEKRHNKWRARIHIGAKEIYLGEFIDKESAIRARLIAEKEYFKEFAPQRHLFEQYGIKYEGCDKNEP